MWQAIQEILTNSNSWITLIFLLLFFIISIVCVKTGLISVNTEKVKISSKDKEQRVMREQISLARTFCLSAMQNILKDDIMRNIDPLHVERVAEKVYDEIIEWIAFNHISTDEPYVKNKVKKVQLLIDTLTPPDKKYDAFDEYIESSVKSLIEDLVNIRKLYS